MTSVKNSKYWRGRFVEQQVLMLEDGQKFYEHLEHQYDAAIREVQNDIDVWYRRFADNNEISYADAKKLLTSRELDEFRWSVEEYIKYGQENAINGQWIKQLENASARVHVSRLESLQLQMQQHVEVLFGNQLDGMDKTMRGILTESYYHTAYEIQKGIGTGWDVQGFDAHRLDTIIRKPWAPDGSNFSKNVWDNRTKLIKNLETDFTQSLIRGDSPDKAINALTKDITHSKHAAGRLVMTESAYYASAGQKECFNELGVERFQIVATLDNETSDICKALDGLHFPMRDYEAGVTAPPFHPWCRTVTAPYFEDDAGTRIARDFEGKTYEVPGDMRYEEWREKYPPYTHPQTTRTESSIDNSRASQYMKLYDKAVEAEPEITAQITKMADKAGTQVEGLEFRLKTKESFERKVLSASAEGKEIRDIIRYTYTAPAADMTSKMQHCIASLSDKGYNTIVVKNYWNKPYNPYNGVNTFVISPNGQVFELQYHTPESFTLKNGKLHELYEKQRVLLDDESPEYLLLSKEMFELSKSLEIPKGIEEVTDK